MSPENAPTASADEQALARYRYLLRTAPPEAIEQVHAEAFARLTPPQRAQALQQIASAVPAHERVALVAGQDDPQALARAATRAELREPGFLERTLGSSGGGMSAGAMIGTSLLGSFVGSLAGSLLAQQLMGGFQGLGGLGDHAADAGYNGFGGVPDSASQDIGAPLQAGQGSYDDLPDDDSSDDVDPAEAPDDVDTESEDVDTESDDVDPGDSGGDDFSSDGGDFGGDDFA